MNKKIFFLILISILILYLVPLAGNPYVFGDIPPPDGGAPTGIIPPPDSSASGSGGGITVTGIVHAAEKTAFIIASGVVVILWVITGLLFLTAQGAPDKLTQAKKALLAAVGGTVLVIVAGSAIALVQSAFGL